MNKFKTFLSRGFNSLGCAVLTAGLLLAASLPARAQFDLFGGPRTFVIMSPQAITTTASNAPVDIHALDGIAKVDIFCVSNTGGGTLTITAYTSPDTTNWTALANYASATSTTVIGTNFYYGGQLKSTNTVLLPGTITTPTATTAGFATKYLLSAPFTNSAAISQAGSGVVQIGFNVSDKDRYFSIQFTGSTNYTVGALLTGKPGGGSVP